jgi:hypothetical protein
MMIAYQQKLKSLQSIQVAVSMLTYDVTKLSLPEQTFNALS